MPPAEKHRMQAACSLAVLEHYEENPYAVRLRLRFVLKRRLHQDSIEARTRDPGSHSIKRRTLMREGYSKLRGMVSNLFANKKIRFLTGLGARFGMKRVGSNECRLFISS